MGVASIMNDDKIVLLADGTVWQPEQEVFWPDEVSDEKITIASEVPKRVIWVDDKPIFSFKVHKFRFIKPEYRPGYGSYEAALQVAQRKIEGYFLGSIIEAEKRLAELRRKYRKYHYKSLFEVWETNLNVYMRYSKGILTTYTLQLGSIRKTENKWIFCDNFDNATIIEGKIEPDDYKDKWKDNALAKIHAYMENLHALDYLE